MLPITHSQSDNIAGGTMQTSITLYETGRLDGVTRTFTKVKLRGFTGGASVVITDPNGHVLWGSEMHSFRVDGSYIGNSDRTDSWSEQVPSEVIIHAGGAAIIHLHNPKPSLGDYIGDLVDDIKQNLFNKKI